MDEDLRITLHTQDKILKSLNRISNFIKESKEQGIETIKFMKKKRKNRLLLDNGNNSKCIIS